MKKSIAIVHYSYPPIIGGVEFIMEGHAKIFAKNDYLVRIITGVGKSKNYNIRLSLLPDLWSQSRRAKKVAEELDAGILSGKFDLLKKIIKTQVKHELRNINVCFIHNVMTMHFNLPFTAAMDEIIDELSQRIKFYIWCHDAALINPDYQFKNEHEYPWNLLKEFSQNAHYVAISKLRQRQIAKLLQIKQNKITVVPDGIDVQNLLGISDLVWRVVEDIDLLSSDINLLFPSRILKRKNYELAIELVHQVNKLKKNCKLLITSPPDVHNPKSMEYYKELHKIVAERNLKDKVIFLYDLKKKYGEKFNMNFSQLKNFYSLCDALIISSYQEGFGIPVIEAGAFRLPILCSDIAPLDEVAKGSSLMFGLKDDPKQTAKKIVEFLDAQPTKNMFKKVLRNYSWESIYKDHLKKLL